MQVALKERAPATVNSLLATKKLLLPPSTAPNTGNDRANTRDESQDRGQKTRKNGQGNKANSSAESAAPRVPHADNFKLSGVGRGLLNGYSREDLTAMAIARKIRNAQHLEKPQLVSRLQTWKREQAKLNKHSDDDDDDPESVNGDKGGNHIINLEENTGNADQQSVVNLANHRPKRGLTSTTEECAVPGAHGEEPSRIQDLVARMLESKLREHQMVVEAQQNTIAQMQKALLEAQMTSDTLLKQRVQPTAQVGHEQEGIEVHTPRKRRGDAEHTLPAGTCCHAARPQNDITSRVC